MSEGSHRLRGCSAPARARGGAGSGSSPPAPPVAAPPSTAPRPTTAALGAEPLAPEEEREFVAYHEAGHAAMAYTLRSPVRLVSIRPTRQWDGICFHSPRRPRLDGDLSGPLVLLPWTVRAPVERAIMITLAGPIAEELFRRRPPGYYVASQDEIAARAAAREATLTSRERGLLAAGELDDASESDAEKSTRLCGGLAVDEVEATALLNWLHAATRSIVFTHSFARLVRALVPELLKHESIGGRRARAILRAADVHAPTRSPP